MREVYIAAVGLTKVDLTGSVFGNVFDLFQTAVRRALAESEIRRFDALQVGIVDSEEFENRANIAATVDDRLGLAGVPAVRSETASSTGAAAFHEACYKVRSGAADDVLVVAGERMKTVTTQVATEIMSKTVDPVERRFGATMPALIALMSQVFLRRHGVAGARVGDALSRLMYRAHALGAENPLAAFAGRPEPLAAWFDRAKNLPVATPLRRKDCSPICDGAAAVILTARPQPVRVAGLGSATDSTSLLDRADLASLPATRRAVAAALYAAGIAELRRVEGLVVEAHDAFNSLLPLHLCDLGLCEPGEAVEALTGSARGGEPASDPYTDRWSGPAGRAPVNLSGGLKSRGHPLGGTGLFQLAELYLQLVGRFPNPRAQAADARLGLSHSIGGPGSNVYVTLLERADSRRRRAELPRPPQLAHGRSVPQPPLALHGRVGLIEAATAIHVTASGEPPIHLALLSLEGRRVFATLPRGVDAGEELAGLSARFVVGADGGHGCELVGERRKAG